MSYPAFKPYRAFGEESDDSSIAWDFEKRTKDQPVDHASVSERSFGSTESKWSVMQSSFVNMFDSHIAHGIGDARSVRSSVSDNLLHELDDMMPRTVPHSEGPTEYDHPRQISLYLHRLGPGLPPDHAAEQREELALLYKILAVVGLAQPNGAIVDLENVAVVARQNFWTLVKRTIVLLCSLILVFGTIMLAEIYHVDLPDFFMHGMFLLVVAVVLAVIIL